MNAPASAVEIELAQLRRVPLLSALSAAELERLAVRAQRITVGAGEDVMRQGDPGECLFILLRGTLEVIHTHEGANMMLARQRPGAFVGEMALLGGRPRNATVRSVGRSELLRIDGAAFQELLAAHPDAAVRVLRAVSDRLTRTETALQRRQALAALGTMAAGLAHELNNPAAAIASSAQQLRSRIAQLADRSTAVGRLTPAAQAVASALHGRARRGLVEPADRSLAEWLRDRGVAAPAVAAHGLARCGFTADVLQEQCAALPFGSRAVLLEWLAVRCDVTALADELVASAQAISDVVRAVRAQISDTPEPFTRVDVHATVRSALLVLMPRLRDRATARVRAAAELPAVAGNPAELSQVWSNVLTNAVEAGATALRVRITNNEGFVKVDLHDNGRGIPEHARLRIFEPFFTTREREGGTGLGLHMVRTIVQRHGGHVQVRSRPGRTIFRVVLPVAPAAAGDAAATAE